MKKNTLKWVLVAVLSGTLVGCGGSDGGGCPAGLPGEDIEISGTWESNFSTTETISNSTWVAFTTDAVVTFNNDLNCAVAQAPANSEFDPSKFKKFEWTEPTTTGFYYCTVDFGRDTALDAANTTNMSDDSDPENSGCGGFSWTMLSLVAE